MRYLIAFGYVVLSGVGIPFALQANDLVGRDYVTLAGEITASWLLEEFFIISSLSFLALLLFKAVAWPFLRTFPHLKRLINAGSLAATGFASASFSLMDHAQVYGNTWTQPEAFMSFVMPSWPAMFIIIVVGIYTGAHLDEGVVRTT